MNQNYSGNNNIDDNDININNIDINNQDFVPNANNYNYVNVNQIAGHYHDNYIRQNPSDNNFGHQNSQNPVENNHINQNFGDANFVHQNSFANQNSGIVGNNGFIDQGLTRMTNNDNNDVIDQNPTIAMSINHLDNNFVGHQNNYQNSIAANNFIDQTDNNQLLLLILQIVNQLLYNNNNSIN